MTLRKRRVMFSEEQEFQRAYESGMLVVYRPMGSKLFRAFVPEEKRKDEKLMDVIRLWSKGIERNGVFYIRATEEEIVCEFGETLWFMDMFDLLIVAPNPETWDASTNNLN